MLYNKYSHKILRQRVNLLSNFYSGPSTNRGIEVKFLIGAAVIYERYKQFPNMYPVDNLCSAYRLGALLIVSKGEEIHKNTVL